MFKWVFIISMLATECLAESVVPIRAIRAGTVISYQDVQLVDIEQQGALTSFDQVVGQEAERTLYPNRPIFAGDLVLPALVERNQTVFIMFKTPAISIITEGRALGRGRPGQFIKAMNLASKSVVYGHIQPDGTILVQN
mgnify:CR=1 FL=1